MAKASARRDGAHARIYASWTTLPAWQQLSASALKLLVHMLATHRPGENGRRDFGARAAALAISASKSTGANAISELEEKGWITPVRLGDFHRKQEPSRYALTCWPNDAEGTPATYAFTEWQPR